MAAAVSTDAAPKRPVMLCLHGYDQNGKQFHDKTLATFRNKLKSKFDFVCPDGFYALDMCANRRCWYPYPDAYIDYEAKEAEYGPAPLLVGKLMADLESLEPSVVENMDWYVEKFKELLAKIPGVTHILGFSQGAAFLNLLVAAGAIPPETRLVFVGGSTFKLPDHDPFPHRSLHIVGKADTVVSPVASMALIKHYANPLLFIHEGGHVVPRIAFAALQFPEASTSASASSGDVN